MNTSVKTQISVVIPVFNGGQVLSACLEAVQKSTFTDYELVVVDDGSSDDTARIAKSLADRVVTHPRNRGTAYARATGVEAARSGLIVFVDADVLLNPQDLGRLVAFFDAHPDVDAATGLLAESHPNPDFLSQYKNLYMHFTFRDLPKTVAFLYGSAFAIRKETFLPPGASSETVYAEDQALAEELMLRGKRIGFLKDWQVVHLKKYTPVSILINDFNIPYHWAKLFVSLRGWGFGTLGRGGTGFAHAPAVRLFSIVIAPLALTSLALIPVWPGAGKFALAFYVSWLALNLRFFIFLSKQRGIGFYVLSVPFTFLDHLVMAAGVACGLAAGLKERLLLWRKK